MTHPAEVAVQPVFSWLQFSHLECQSQQPNSVVKQGCPLPHIYSPNASRAHRISHKAAIQNKLNHDTRQRPLLAHVRAFSHVFYYCALCRGRGNLALCHSVACRRFSVDLRLICSRTMRRQLRKQRFPSAPIAREHRQLSHAHSSGRAFPAARSRVAASASPQQPLRSLMVLRHSILLALPGEAIALACQTPCVKRMALACYSCCCFCESCCSASRC